MPSNQVLTVTDLSVTLKKTWGRTLPIVDEASFSIGPGETMGLVGESGCGKTLTALAIMDLLRPPLAHSGSIQIGDTELNTLQALDMRALRGNRMAMVFQDPNGALNPVLPIGEQMSEVLAVHRRIKGMAARSECLQALQRVGIPEPAARLRQYPHQLSGGTKQRVVIAMALLCDPDLLILDEPTTALDLTVQAQLLDLLERVQSHKPLAILLITHDLGVVGEIADHIAIMYAGKILELGSVDNLRTRPAHPYTAALLAAVPHDMPRRAPLRALPGFPPDFLDPFRGCPFAPRCNRALSLCREKMPDWTRLDSQQFRCHHPLTTAPR
jgi:oligopeptide/dipeptide ABC transporter ATP-binding protein